VASGVVIVEGGFGSLYAARRLERRLPRHPVVPLREEPDRTDIRLGRVTGADPDRNEVHLHTVGGLDWGVGLFFGRASAEPGQLGHPAALREPDGDR
jgi:hypothetical protein